MYLVRTNYYLFIYCSPIWLERADRFRSYNQGREENSLSDKHWKSCKPGALRDSSSLQIIIRWEGLLHWSRNGRILSLKFLTTFLWFHQSRTTNMLAGLRTKLKSMKKNSVRLTIRWVRWIKSRDSGFIYSLSL